MDGPIKKYRAGCVEVAIWQRSTKVGEVERKFLSVTIGKSYKDKEGKWRRTGSLGINEIPKALIVLWQAYWFVLYYKDYDKDLEIREEEFKF